MSDLCHLMAAAQNRASARTVARVSAWAAVLSGRYRTTV